MAATHAHADQTNTARLTLPPDIGEATRFTKKRLEKLLADRAWVASRLRDLVQDAKANGYTTGTTRKAMSIDGLTDAKREKYFDDMRRAAQLFGMTLDVHEGDTDKSLFEYVAKARHLRDEKKEVDTAIKELREIAIENGVDYAAVKLILQKPAKLDAENEGGAEEWFHRLDAVGAFLGFW